MATTVFKASDQSGLASAVTSSTINELLSQQQESNIQLKLTTLLQTTLKLEPLFDLFFGQVQHLLKINSCHYTFDAKEIDLQLGKANTHTADYALNLQNQYLGNIVFSRKQRFTDAELVQIESLLGILVYPLRNSLTYQDAIQQALHDPLTGLGNRGALEQAINHQWQMSQRYDQHFSLMMIDLDHFKSINDTYGHSAGDSVLKMVAHCIKTTTRQTDLCYRYGGEEFMVILNKSQPLGASIIAERIRENIASLKVPVDDTGKNSISVTTSIGYSCSQQSDHVQTLIEQADHALYMAKHAGRNQVAFFEPDEKSHTQRNLLITPD